MCLTYFGFEENEGVLHAASVFLLLAVIAFQVAVTRWWHGLGRYLPALGIAVLLLFAFTWAASAGDLLAKRTGGDEFPRAPDARLAVVAAEIVAIVIAVVTSETDRRASRSSTLGRSAATSGSTGRRSAASSGASVERSAEAGRRVRPGGRSGRCARLPPCPRGY